MTTVPAAGEGWNPIQDTILFVQAVFADPEVLAFVEEASWELWDVATQVAVAANPDLEGLVVRPRYRDVARTWFHVAARISESRFAVRYSDRLALGTEERIGLEYRDRGYAVGFDVEDVTGERRTRLRARKSFHEGRLGLTYERNLFQKDLPIFAEGTERFLRLDLLLPKRMNVSFQIREAEEFTIDRIDLAITLYL